MKKIRGIGCILLVLFSILAIIVMVDEKLLVNFDNYWTNLVRQDINNGGVAFFKVITTLANSVSIAIVAVSVAVYLLYKRLYGNLLYLAINVGLIAGVLNNFVIKLIVNRARPTIEHLVVVHDASFPSGHTLGSLLCYGTILIFIWQHHNSKPVKVIASIFLGSLIILIPISRVYLGVHFPSDVLGGWLLGLGFLCVTGLGVSYIHKNKN